MAKSNNRLGILLMCLTSLVFALQDGLSRHLAENYNVFVVVMIRYWFFAAFVILMAMRNGGLGQAVRTKHPYLQIIRGLILALEICVTVAAFTLLGLTETHAIFACFPLMIAALSGPVLGETVGIRRWFAIGLGAVGVLVILRPGNGVFAPAAAVPLLGAAMFAAYHLMTRYVAIKDSTATSFFYTGVSGCVVMTVIGLFYWQPIVGTDLVWMLILSCGALVGHWLLIKTYEYAEASVVQPFAFLQLPFAVILGIAFFAETLRINVAMGASIVVCAGVFTLWREHHQGP
ncbi:DMT family transporter [Cognatishimia sp. WU-CL00825]|uniref:DMT family transporter n=1 Tax=Cognatishimia sp. WU-CL00825 TaxID=3127658 RepID=UPI0031097CB8